MTRDEQWQLADKWRGMAREHETAAEEIMRELIEESDPARDEELALHKEVADTLRQCAHDLLAINQPQPEEIKF